MTGKYIEKATRNLVRGDEILSVSGKKLKVTNVIQKENRTIILFDGDMEIDFDPYFRLNVASHD